MQKSKTKVLIIDDNDSILQYLKTFLERYMFEVQTCLDGYEGIQQSAEFKPDIIFLDLMMPNIDGLQMLELKKVLNDIKEIPVIVISANAARKNVLAAIEAGADRVLSKPINSTLLKATVDELLGRKNFEVKSKRITEEKSPQKNNDIGENNFISSFEESKNRIINAINSRDEKTIREVANQFTEESNKMNYTKINDISNELRINKYLKPSDWMLAEIKIKQLAKEVNEIKRQYS